jgi:hypothetical protein
MTEFSRLTQRDAMRRLLAIHGYDKRRVCEAYAAGDRRGEIRRKSDINEMSPEAYADEMWRDGHRSSGPWILAFCKRHGIGGP